MREIKFRAWGESTKMMHYPYADYGGFGGQSSGDILNRFDNVMQFTGLKDKNGKEIWEGDIVRQWKYNYVVKFGEYMVDGLDFYSNHTEAGFYLESPKAEPGNTSGIRPTDCEVIGNIYENPELLK